jgi:HAD superfamily hydrolase (TIGR01549 family)
VTDGIRLLSLDAGNTIVFLDHDVVAEVVAATVGTVVSAKAIARAEGVAKKKLDAKQLLPPLVDNDINRAWGAFMATLVQLAAEVDEARAGECARALWREHRRFNLWRKVPDGLVDAVAAVRAGGVPVVVVSNSEGELQSLFDKLGIGGAFDLVIDSHDVGVEKPDPRIFRLALERFGVAPAEALHVGDTFTMDVAGARAAGLRVALVDPFGHYEGEYLDVPRVADVASLCRAIASGR